MNLPVCNIVMEACGSANYWSRKFISYGHEVSQISPQHVKPFVQGNKNDKNDARAIVIASQQDGMSTVPIKPVEQQEIQMLHRYRDSLEQERTALSNRIRGYLREMGLFLPQGLPQVRIYECKYFTFHERLLAKTDESIYEVATRLGSRNY
ncbi:MAG: IS110 family transposase ISPpr8 [Legionella sp.]|uniref:IS110 family transposase n=1 Tax=Legionella sp. TaxID=459 RepID=UPI003D1307A6